MLPDVIPQRFTWAAGGELARRMERSPAASTAVAIADAVKSLVEPTPEQDCFSTAVCTDGNPYGIREGLICSMPCWSEVIRGLATGTCHMNLSAAECVAGKPSHPLVLKDQRLSDVKCIGDMEWRWAWSL